LVRDDSIWHTMQAQNALNVQHCIFPCLVAGTYWNEVGRLDKLINNHPNEIRLAGRPKMKSMLMSSHF
jgi:hypothetical protein